MNSNPYVIKLKTTISKEDQLTLIENVKKNGAIAAVEQNIMEPFWIADGLTYFDDHLEHSIPEELLQRYYYLVRGNPHYRWSWKDSSDAQIIQRILKPLEGLTAHITRVATIIQIPGKAVPAHRDMIIGNTYNFMESPTSTFTGSHRMCYRGDEWFHKQFGDIQSLDHAKQGYFGLRIPLTEHPFENGKAFIEDFQGNKKYYNSGNNLFLLNEAEVKHGADPVEFYRGVIIVDCIIDLEVLNLYLP